MSKLKQKANPAGIQASSATYRKATKKLANVLSLDPQNSKYPKEDFDFMLDKVDEKSKERALEWYRRGIKRGIIYATDLVLKEILELKNKTLYAPNQVNVSVRIRFKGEDWNSSEFNFSAEELGFEE